MSTDFDGGQGPNSGSFERDHDGRLKALIEHSFDVIALVGPDGTVEYVSPAIGRVLGYTPDEFIGLNGFEQIHPEDVEEVRRRFGEVLEQPGASLAIDTRLRHKDGSWRWVESRVTNLLEEPAVRAVVSNFRDVTERKLAEEEARQRQEELTDFIENATVGLHWVGPGRDDPLGEPGRAGAARLRPRGVRRPEHRRVPRRPARHRRHPPEARAERGAPLLRGPPPLQGRLDSLRPHQLERPLAGRGVRPHPVLHAGHHRAEAARGGVPRAAAVLAGGPREHRRRRDRDRRGRAASRS